MYHSSLLHKELLKPFGAVVIKNVMWNLSETLLFKECLEDVQGQIIVRYRLMYRYVISKIKTML